MGEYAMYGNQEIKIGTCENMYYLRADQARKVRPLPGNVDPVREAHGIRFRFPFPDEDDCAPGGEFHGRGYMRGIPVDVELPANVEHGSLQFRAEPGWLLYPVPCPVSADGQAFAKANLAKFSRNGAPGPVEIVQQRCPDGLDGVCMLVCRCTACGALWRVPTLKEALPYIAACEKQQAREKHEAKVRGEDRPDAGRFWRLMAERIAAGYEVA